MISNLWQLTDRQLADTTTQRRHFFTDNQLADTTTGRHDKSQTHFLKTHRHSPTLTDRDFPRKRMKRNIFFYVNIALFSERTHLHFAFSNTNTCTCLMASFSLYGYLTYGYNLIRLHFECICICSQVGDTPSTTSHRVHGPLCICSLQKLICFCPSGIGWTKNQSPFL